MFLEARELSTLDSDKVTSFTVTMFNPLDDKKVAELIELKYPDELQTFTQANLSEQIGGIIDNLKILAVAVALISSVVAGIGIANTMLMSVLERFKEIGALKAVGWTNDDIVKMVLYESLFIGIIGGIFGVLLGFIAAQAIASFGLVTKVSLQLAVGSFFGAIIVGLIGGLYPAFIASRMDPIEALRSE